MFLGIEEAMQRRRKLRARWTIDASEDLLAEVARGAGIAEGISKSVLPIHRNIAIRIPEGRFGVVTHFDERPDIENRGYVFAPYIPVYRNAEIETPEWGRRTVTSFDPISVE